MKRIFTFLAVVLLTTRVFAQSPEKMSYQAVIRNSSNQLVTNQSVGMQISILLGSPSGTAVYTETQTPTTNANGLVSIEIGGGASFSAIDWANGSYFIKTETDPTGGANYTITGTSQILSVPYALHAKTAENAFNQWTTENNGISYQDGTVSVADINIKDSSEIFFKGNGQIRSADNNHRILFRKSENIFEIREWEDIIFSSGSVVGTETNTMNIQSDGNVGIGIEEPTEKLEVDGNIDIHNNTLKNLSNPVNAQDAATKKYVDDNTADTTSGNETVFDNWDKTHADDVLLTGDQTISGIKIFTDKIIPNGIILPHSFGPDPDYLGEGGNFIAFAHSGYSEDFIGYKNNTFYLKDSPGGGDISDPNLVVGGRIGIGIEEPVEKLEVEGNIDIHNHTLKNLSNPENDQDAATKSYVDDIAGATTYSIGLNNDLGGYIFYVAPEGHHGLVAAWNDQENSSEWYQTQNYISMPENHYTAGKKYTDWRLPTIYELNLMYNQKDQIGGFSTAIYWSSTEYDSDHAWGKSFSSGVQVYYAKDGKAWVRAIRSF